MFKLPKAFCKKCIDNWSKKSQQCPNRCNNPNYQKSIGKNDILSKLKFKCKGCDNPILYDNIRKHYNESKKSRNFMG